MKNFSLILMATVMAIQILLFGLLALSCNSAILGFMCGLAIPECIRFLHNGVLEEDD
jgi:hypothetical protein